MIADIAFIIPAKGVSTRLPNKNGLPFGDQPTLIDWKISQLIKVVPKTAIFLSTEHEPFKKIGEKWGIKIHHRNPNLSDDTIISFSDVLYAIINDINCNHICWVPVTTPLTSTQDYQNAILNYQKYVISGDYDSLVAVNQLKDYIWDDETSLNYSAGSTHVISQNLPNWYKITNAIYMISKDLALTRKYFLGSNPYKMITSKISGVDIDYLEDYEIAKALYNLYLSQNNE